MVALDAALVAPHVLAEFVVAGLEGGGQGLGPAAQIADHAHPGTAGGPGRRTHPAARPQRAAAQRPGQGRQVDRRVGRRDHPVIVAQRRAQRLDQPAALLEREQAENLAAAVQDRQPRVRRLGRGLGVAGIEIGMGQGRIGRAQGRPGVPLGRAQGVDRDLLTQQRFGHPNPSRRGVGHGAPCLSPCCGMVERHGERNRDGGGALCGKGDHPP